MMIFDSAALWALSEAFLKNLALLIVLAYLLSLLWSSADGKVAVWRQVVSGGIFSVAAVACMNMPLEPQPGLLLDQRGLILLFAAPFGGPWAAVIAGAATGLYRIHLGGIGTLPGLGAIAATVLLSLLFTRYGGALRSAKSAAMSSCPAAPRCAVKTLAPCSASSCAVACPMPLDAPVTSAVFP